MTILTSFTHSQGSGSDLHTTSPIHVCVHMFICIDHSNIIHTFAGIWQSSTHHQPDSYVCTYVHMHRPFLHHSYTSQASGSHLHTTSPIHVCVHMFICKDHSNIIHAFAGIWQSSTHHQPHVTAVPIPETHALPHLDDQKAHPEMQLVTQHKRPRHIMRGKTVPHRMVACSAAAAAATGVMQLLSCNKTKTRLTITSSAAAAAAAAATQVGVQLLRSNKTKMSFTAVLSAAAAGQVMHLFVWNHIKMRCTTI
jgi:hypothetical protein